MKSQFISRLLNAQWDFGTQSRTHQIIGNIVRRLLKDERPDEDISGAPLPKMEIVGDVARIPIRGILALNVPDWIKSYGFAITDINDVEQEQNQALNDPKVKIILEHYDSPGGESVAGQKLFDINEAARRKKPLLSWSGDGEMVCSAAFNGAAASTEIILGKYCEAVAIGSYMVNVDDTGFWEQMGMKLEVFRSGEYKGIGLDPLSEAQRAYFQSITEQYGELFRKNVSKYLPAPRDSMQGQSYRGVDAASLGFAFALAKDMPAAVAKFRSRNL